MKWDAVEITDNSDKSYKGNQAKQFVDVNCPDAPIRTYKEGKISVTINKVKSVKPFDVKKVLQASLQGKIKSLKVSGETILTQRALVPKKATGNVSNLVPEYTITLELGDIDALFEPVASTAEPWKEKGVRQRLQVLGYLYTPLEHPGNNAPDFHHAKACWDYYKRVHKEADNAAAVAKLKNEIYGNLLTGSFPKSGVILAKSKLPGTGTFAAIRFPGGYGTTKSAGTTLRGGDHYFNGSNLNNIVDRKYDFGIGDPRHKIEKVVFDENPLLGKIPLIAKVMKKFPGEEAKPAMDVPVLFQLVVPDNLPGGSEFAAPPLPHKVMNYSLGGFFWKSEAYPQTEDHDGLNQLEWKAVHRITKAAYQQDPANAATIAKTWIDAWSNAVPVAVPWDAVKDWWGNQAQMPYTRLEMELETAKKYVRHQITPPPPAPSNGYDEPKWDLLIRLFHAAKAANPNWMQAKNLAKGWIDTWAASGDSPSWDDVSAWWGNQADQPYKPMPIPRSESFNVEDPINYTKNQLDTIKRGFDIPSRPPTVPLPQWDGVKKIVQAAKRQHPADPNAAIALAESLVDTWNSDPRIGWNDVQAWWGNQLEVPYPTLRNDKVETAKGRVDFLLNDRLAGLGREEELLNIGQKKYIDDLMTQINSGLAITDPQKNNAPNAVWGGKAGVGIEVIFDKPKSQQEGFHTQRPTQNADYGTLNLAALPADTVKNPHALECKTNDKGFAGVIFKPSHCGGDRYKLCVYIDRDHLQEKTPGVIHKHSAVETGTMVVWRNLRIYRYLQLQTTPINPSPALRELLREGNCKINGEKFGEMFLNSPLTELLIIPNSAAPMPGAKPEGNYPPLGIGYLVKDGKTTKEQLLKYRPVSVSATHFETHFRQGYCELIADCDGIEKLTEREYDEAFEKGKTAFVNCGKLSKTIKWDAFFLKDLTSPFFLNIRGHNHYNELTKNEKDVYPPLVAKDADNLTWCLQNFLEAMCEHFAGGGVLPGLTVVQIPRGDTWDQFAADGICASPITSGYGTASRAAFLAWTAGKYEHSFIYPATSNALHEIGHVLGLCHQFAGGGYIDAAHQDAITEKFQQPKPDDCVCVMSYTGCYGDFCGKCLLSLRGWATH